MTQLISKEMPIGDVMQRYPASIDLMIKYGMKFGCSVNTRESITESALRNGIEHGKISELVEKLNEMAEKTPELARSGGTVRMTDGAAEKLKTIMKEHKKEDYALRIGVMPGGCSGFMYSFDFDNNKREDDIVVIDKGVTVFVDAASMTALKNSTVDYVESLQGAGFNIENPNASSSCGCGKSFH